MNSFRGTCVPVLLAALVLVTWTAVPAAADNLFGAASASDVPSDRYDRDLDDPTIERVRYVVVDFDLIRDATKPVTLNLFEGVAPVAVPERIRVRERGWTWFGHVAGDETRLVVLTVENDLLAGSVLFGAERYQVRPVQDGNATHGVYQIREDGFPESEDDTVTPPKPAEPSGPDTISADDGTVIDVLTVYTPAARAAVGGQAAMEALIQLAVDESNLIHALSGVDTSFFLVHTAEVDYTESGNWSTDLGRLQGTSDGYMDEVHDLRNQYCADLVNLVINDSAYCGLGYLMDPVGSYFADYAFSLIYWDCATGYYSDAHEIGHNMSARHDRYVDNTDSPFTFNHGHVHTSDVETERWRTTMAYNNECSDLGYNCTRLPYWSNQVETYPNSDPMGSATVDNAQCLEITRTTVAAFRERADCETPVTLVSFAAQADGATVDVTWETATERDAAGFHLWRAAGEDGEYERITPSMIPSEGDPFNGAVYSHRDEGLGAGTYFYQLEDIAMNGTSTFHGPTSVDVIAQPSIGCGMAWGPMGLDLVGVLLVGFGAALVSRKKGYRKPQVKSTSKDEIIRKAGPAQTCSPSPANCETAD